MALNIEQQLTPFAGYTAVDLESLALAGATLTIGYSHAAQLSLTAIAADHTQPIPRLAHVRVWDDGHTLEDGATAQDAEHPVFEGFVEEVAPGGDGHRVRLVAFDPTYRAAREIPVMSLPWEPGIADANPELHVWPDDGDGAIPRLVLNVADEADADYARERAHGYTVGQIIGLLLDDQLHPLWWRNAAPGTLLDGPSPCYVADDVAGMTFVPQGKLVWDTESIRAGTERMQRLEPRYRLVFVPGARLWRFRDLTAAPAVTLVLNDPTVAHPVLSLDLSPSFERAVPAIKIYGPATTETAEFVWYDEDFLPEGFTNTLETVGSPIVLEPFGAGDIVTWRKWQIVDATKRSGARALPEWYAARTSQYIWENVKQPVFLLSWDGATFYAAQGAYLDFLNGSAEFKETLPYAFASDQFGQSIKRDGQHYFPPVAAKLVWAQYVAPLTVRVPETGFEGTANADAGLQFVHRVYDEDLSIGVEYGTPVTSAARRAAMTILAQNQLDKAKDITWVGGCVLDGIDYQWCRLNRRVNFTVADGSGGTTAAGWSAINAYVTDVAYDYTERTTTLTFSSDRAETIGEDVAQLKERLKIKALEQRRTETVEMLFRTMVNWKGGTYQEWSGVRVTSGFEYIDPETGQRQ